MANVNQRRTLLLLKYIEVAEACRVSYNTVAQWVANDKIRVEKNGGSKRIPITELSPTAQENARRIVASKEKAAT